MVSKIKKYSEKDAAKAFGQLVKAIQYMQENQVVHRDLKPENLLLKSPNREMVVLWVEVSYGVCNSRSRSEGGGLWAGSSDQAW